jgi:hypothetical protein
MTVDLYSSLRARAEANHRSISAETLSLLEQVLPGASELKRRAAFYNWIKCLRSRNKAVGAGPASEDLLREDRER